MSGVNFVKVYDQLKINRDFQFFRTNKTFRNNALHAQQR